MSAALGPDYEVFGLRVRSDLPLTELFEAEGHGSPDVMISRSSLDRKNAKAGLESDGDSLLLTVPGVAKYRISGGREIIIDPAEGTSERNVRLYLLGSAFGALLHQRGLLPLHANAVEIDGRAVAFMGESGAGKSTLAAWFHDHGYRIIADDVCVVDFDPSGCPVAIPGLPRLRMWEEALKISGRSVDEFQRSYADPDGEFDKFDVPIAASDACATPLPLAAIYLLKRRDAFTVKAINRLEAIQAMFEHTYRGAYLTSTSSRKAHWSLCVRLIAKTRLFGLARSWDLGAMDSNGERILAHVRDCP